MGKPAKKDYFTVPENNRLLVTLNQLEITYCYQSVNVISWLLLSFGYCNLLVIVISWLMLSGGSCYPFTLIPKGSH